jgi:ABC-type transporter Mla MlaB component
MEAMTDNSARPHGIEVVLSGAVTVETLQPILRCLRHLAGASNAYLIRADDVSRIDTDAAELLYDFVAEVAAHGGSVRWVAAARALINTARAIAGAPRGRTVSRLAV